MPFVFRPGELHGEDTSESNQAPFLEIMGEVGRMAHLGHLVSPVQRRSPHAVCRSAGRMEDTGMPAVLRDVAA